MAETPPPPHHSWRTIVLLAAFAINIMLIWYARPDGRTHVFFLNTKGDAELIQTPGGSYILIDGGADPVGTVAALGQHMPFWRRSLDAVVLSAPDASRVAGQVAALARYRAALVWAAPFSGRNATLAEWQRVLAEDATPIHIARAGERLVIDGVELRVLASGDGKESGMLLRLDYGATSVVFCQSSSAADEEALAAAGMLRPATLVAFPWQRDPHTATLETLRPRAVVFTDGYVADAPDQESYVDRRVGHEALYHEKINGTIEWISDGSAARVVTEQAGPWRGSEGSEIRD